MSRSYKKTPCHKDNDIKVKRKFNRSIRRKAKVHISACIDYDEYVGDVPYNGYKRLNCSWDIVDYYCIYHTKRDLEWVYWLWPDDEEQRNKVLYQTRMK